MKNRTGFLFFLGALASSLMVGACGADDDCDALCDKAAECDSEEARSECLATCERMNFPPEFIECAVDLSCNPSTEEMEACVRAVEPSAACRNYCAKPCVQTSHEDERLCGSACTMLSPEAQACLAALDGDSCGENHDCLALDPSYGEGSIESFLSPAPQG